MYIHICYLQIHEQIYKNVICGVSDRRVVGDEGMWEGDEGNKKIPKLYCWGEGGISGKKYVMYLFICGMREARSAALAHRTQKCVSMVFS